MQLYIVTIADLLKPLLIGEFTETHISVNSIEDKGYSNKLTSSKYCIFP